MVGDGREAKFNGRSDSYKKPEIGGGEEAALGRKHGVLNYKIIKEIRGINRQDYNGGWLYENIQGRILIRIG